MLLIDIQTFADLSAEEKRFIELGDMPMQREVVEAYWLYVLEDGRGVRRLLAPSGSVTVGEEVAYSEAGSYQRSLSVVQADAQQPFEVRLEILDVPPVAVSPR
jgi:hypothetical protein